MRRESNRTGAFRIVPQDGVTVEHVKQPSSVNERSAAIVPSRIIARWTPLRKEGRRVVEKTVVWCCEFCIDGSHRCCEMSGIAKKQSVKASQPRLIRDI